MTPKEKARELVDKYLNFIVDDITDTKIIYGQLNHKLAKQCALIAVDEVLNLCWGGNKIGIKHWEEVEQELLNL
jgi:hypothetical protein